MDVIWKGRRVRTLSVAQSGDYLVERFVPPVITSPHLQHAKQRELEDQRLCRGSRPSLPIDVVGAVHLEEFERAPAASSSTR